MCYKVLDWQERGEEGARTQNRRVDIIMSIYYDIDPWDLWGLNVPVCVIHKHIRIAHISSFVVVVVLAVVWCIVKRDYKGRSK